MLCENKMLSNNKRIFYISLLSAFIWGLAAHGYVFMHANFSHDSLAEFDGTVISNSIKFMSGRYLVPLVRMLFRTNLTLPWLIGLLSLIWIGCAVYFTAKIFKITSASTICLIAGVYATNLAVSCTAACFIHDLDSDMLALLFAVIAVYIWQKGKWYWLPGALMVTASLALYQSYILVTVVLVMFVCIMDTINADKFPNVFLSGIKGICMLLIGGGLYFLGMMLTKKIVGFTRMTGQFQAIASPMEMSWFDFKYVFRETYETYFSRMGFPLSPYPEVITSAIFRGVVVLFLVALFIGLCNRKTPIIQKLLCIALVCLLPFAMNMLNMVYATHELMRFSYYLIYPMALVLCDWLVHWLRSRLPEFKNQTLLKLPKYLCSALVFLTVFSSVQVANVFYLKKDLEHEGYVSLMTRILYRIEDYEGYEPGVTPVVLVGLPEQINKVIPGFAEYTEPNGVQTSDVLAFMTQDRAQAFFNYYLNSPILFADAATWDSLSTDPEILQLPNYPDPDCIAMIDDTILVMKLGDSQH